MKCENWWKNKKTQQIGGKKRAVFCAQVLMAIKLTHMESIVRHQLVRCNKNVHHSLSTLWPTMTILTFLIELLTIPFLLFNLANFAMPPDTTASQSTKATKCILLLYFFIAMLYRESDICVMHTIFTILTILNAPAFFHHFNAVRRGNCASERTETH